MEHNFESLKAHILSLSVARHFDAARREWDLISIEVSEEFDHCPCGQEIKEHCFIRNRLNGETTYVGNVCINRFIGIDTGNLFGGLRRIAQDTAAGWRQQLLSDATSISFGSCALCGGPPSVSLAR